jgi:hypothetical protein
MPEPGNSRIPTLSTFAEIGRFCNPITTTSKAVICNATLWSVIQELLENARTKAFNAGGKEGYDKGREELKNTKCAEELAYENGWREGHETGLDEGKEEREVTGKLTYEKGKTAEREAWEMKHGQGRCVEPWTRIQVNKGVQTGSTVSIPMDSCTQTTPTCTVDAVTQTALQDEPLRLLRDAGMSTGTPITSTGPPSPTVPSPQPAPLPATSRPMTYASHHTATSRLPMPLTTATTAPSPPSKWPPAPQK